jgi:hypothetical protein
MKASELLTLALAQYENQKFAYMCHEIEQIAHVHGCAMDADQFLSDKIHAIMAPHGTIVIHNVLRNTSKKYAGYVNRYGHNCKACLKMRVAFWQDMIAELKTEGL